MEIPRDYINPKYYADFQRRYQKEIKKKMKKKKSNSNKNTTDNEYPVLDLTTTSQTLENGNLYS